MVVIGIDFGNESCIVSCVVGNQIKTIENEYFKSKTPSCVAFTERKRLIGTAAKNQLSSNVENTISDFKQCLGSYESSPFTFGSVDFFEKSSNATLCFNVNSMDQPASFTPVHIASMLLAKLKADANATLKDSQVSGCVLAVPSYFNESEKKAFLTAAGIAKLDCHYLIKETTAIAINYSFFKKFPTRQNVFFVDLGHSAVQIFACAFENEKLEVLAEASTKIGGRDIDEALAEHFIECIGNETATKDNKTFWIGLLEEVEKLKKKLSGDSASFPLNVQHLLNEEVAALSLDRLQMEQICEPLYSKIYDATLQCCYESGVELQDVDSVEILGGSARIPYIKKMIKCVFGMKPKMTMNDEAVSRGCLFRFILSRKRPHFEIIQKTSEEMKSQSSDLLANATGESLTIKEVHNNFKDDDGYLSMTKSEFKALESTEVEFIQNEVNENLRYEARNKLEKLVITYNTSKFIDILSPQDRDKFINLTEKVKFFHNKTKEEYERFHVNLESFIRKNEKKLKYQEEQTHKEQEREEQKRKEQEYEEEMLKEQEREEQKRKEKEREEEKRKEQERKEQMRKEREEQKRKEKEREEQKRKEQEREEQKRKEKEREEEKRKEQEREEQMRKKREEQKRKEQERKEQKRKDKEREEEKRKEQPQLIQPGIETRSRKHQNIVHKQYQVQSNTHQSENQSRTNLENPLQRDQSSTCLPSEWSYYHRDQAPHKNLNGKFNFVRKEPHPLGNDFIKCWDLFYEYANQRSRADIRQLIWDANFFLNTEVYYNHFRLLDSECSQIYCKTLSVCNIIVSEKMCEREKEMTEALFALKEEINQAKNRCYTLLVPTAETKISKF